MISTGSWERSLRKSLLQFESRTGIGSRPRGSLRLAIVGLGNELMGDDAVGILIARNLKSLLSDRQNILIIEAGTTPANIAGTLRRFEPGFILWIDAAHIDRPPGSAAWISGSDLTGISCCTHSFPLSHLIEYLKRELSAEMGIIGVQPLTNHLESSVSVEAQESVGRISNQILQTLQAIP